jgi:hypothetical protein
MKYWQIKTLGAIASFAGAYLICCGIDVFANKSIMWEFNLFPAGLSPVVYFFLSYCFD